jgi:hypothetical protein
VNYQVLVESMDCQLAHIGLYANRDVSRDFVSKFVHTLFFNTWIGEHISRVQFFEM